MSILANNPYRKIGDKTYYISDSFQRVGHDVLISDGEEPKVGTIVRKADSGLFDIKVEEVRKTITREWIKVVFDIEVKRETIDSLTEKVKYLESRVSDLEEELNANSR